MLDFISTDLIAWDQSTDAIMASGTRTYIISSARNKLRKGFNHVTMQNLKYDIVIQDKLEVQCSMSFYSLPGIRILNMYNCHQLQSSHQTDLVDIQFGKLMMTMMYYRFTRFSGIRTRDENLGLAREDQITLTVRDNQI